MAPTSLCPGCWIGETSRPAHSVYSAAGSRPKESLPNKSVEDECNQQQWKWWRASATAVPAPKTYPRLSPTHKPPPRTLSSHPPPSRPHNGTPWPDTGVYSVIQTRQQEPKRLSFSWCINRSTRTCYKSSRSPSKKDLQLKVARYFLSCQTATKIPSQRQMQYPRRYPSEYPQSAERSRASTKDDRFATVIHSGETVTRSVDRCKLMKRTPYRIVTASHSSTLPAKMTAAAASTGTESAVDTLSRSFEHYRTPSKVSASFYSPELDALSSQGSVFPESAALSISKPSRWQFWARTQFTPPQRAAARWPLIASRVIERTGSAGKSCTTAPMQQHQNPPKGLIDTTKDDLRNANEPDEETASTTSDCSTRDAEHYTMCQRPSKENSGWIAPCKVSINTTHTNGCSDQQKPPQHFAAELYRGMESSAPSNTISSNTKEDRPWFFQHCSDWRQSDSLEPCLIEEENGWVLADLDTPGSLRRDHVSDPLFVPSVFATRPPSRRHDNRCSPSDISDCLRTEMISATPKTTTSDITTAETATPKTTTPARISPKFKELIPQQTFASKKVMQTVFSYWLESLIHCGLCNINGPQAWKMKCKQNFEPRFSFCSSGLYRWIDFLIRWTRSYVEETLSHWSNGVRNERRALYRPCLVLLVYLTFVCVERYPSPFSSIQTSSWNPVDFPVLDMRRYTKDTYGWSNPSTAEKTTGRFIDPPTCPIDYGFPPFIAPVPSLLSPIR